MLINKKFKCPDCGRVVEGIKETNGTYRCHCSHCYDWWNASLCSDVEPESVRDTKEDY